MINVTIDGKPVEVEPGTLVIEAAKKVGIEIPVFCYHPHMKPVAACRMCLVEIEKMGKLQPSCATPVSEGMVVHTDTAPVKKAQAGVLEFLLAQHPLDCPICDKGGECPLQDQSFAYGPGATRFAEEKRHFHKHWTLGPLVVLDQERCVQCQRCTRFMEEIVGDPVLVLKERGARTVVDSAEGRSFDNLFGGNVVEMCPVGALTSHPYRFRARPWDITQVSSVCPHCPVGCNLTLTNRDGRVLRMLSRENASIDQGWLCDRGRFGYGFLTDERRLMTPLIRREGTLLPASWEEAVSLVQSHLRGRVGALGGGRLSTEALAVFARYLREAVGTENLDWRTGGQLTSLPPVAPGAITDVDDAEVFVFLESEPLAEVPVLGLRIRQNVVHGRQAVVFAMGARVATDLDAAEMLYAPGQGGDVVAGLLKAEGALGDALRSPKKVVILWNGKDAGIHRALSALVDGREGETRIIVTGGLANAQGAERVRFMPRAGASGADGILRAGAAGDLDALLVLEEDIASLFPDGRLAGEALEKTPFVVSLTHFMNPTAEAADVVLPLAAFAEAEGTFYNLEGRAQRFEPGAAVPGECRQDWEIPFLLWGREPSLAEARRMVEDALREKPFAPRVQTVATEGLLLGASVYYRGITPEPHLSGTVVAPKAVFEVSPKTAESLGVADGDEVQPEGTELTGEVRVSTHVADGVVALAAIPGANTLSTPIRLRALERRL